MQLISNLQKDIKNSVIEAKDAKSKSENDLSSAKQKLDNVENEVGEIISQAEVSADALYGKIVSQATNQIEIIEKNANKNVYKLLIGNKCDLEDKRKVTYQEGKDFATSNGMQFIETSAKADTKVKEAFELLTQEIIKASITKDKGMEKKEKTVHLSSGGSDLNTKPKGGCC